VAPERYKRKKLKQDSFVDWTERSLEYVQHHYVALGVGLLAIVVVLVGFSVYRHNRAAAHRAASQLLYQAETAYDGGDYVLALDLFERYVDGHGGSSLAPVARLQLAKSLHANGRSGEALDALDQLLPDVQPPITRADVLIVKATVLSDLERYDDAAAVYSETLEGDLPDAKRRDVTDRLVDCYRLAGQPKQALQVLEKLRDRVAAGEIDGRVYDIESRIAYFRALAGL
jgi:predicted negative regulator of RcsB-dependent stress response